MAPAFRGWTAVGSGRRSRLEASAWVGWQSSAGATVRQAIAHTASSARSRRIGMTVPVSSTLAKQPQARSMERHQAWQSATRNSISSAPASRSAPARQRGASSALAVTSSSGPSSLGQHGSRAWSEQPVRRDGARRLIDMHEVQAARHQQHGREQSAGHWRQPGRHHGDACQADQPPASTSTRDPGRSARKA